MKASKKPFFLNSCPYLTPSDTTSKHPKTFAYLESSYDRDIKQPYTNYAIPTEIRPSVFPYFLNQPKKTISTPIQSFEQPSSNPKKKLLQNPKFILKLPNKAFRMKQLNFKKINATTFSDQMKPEYQERSFSAIKKTLPLEHFQKEKHYQERIKRVFKNEENIKKESFLKYSIPSFSPAQKMKRSIRKISPKNNKVNLNKELNGVNNSRLSLRSSINLELMKKKGNKEKAFFDLYLNNFDDSPINKMKTSRISRNSSATNKPFNILQNNDVTSPLTENILLINKVKCNDEDDNMKDSMKKDNNFLKILLHYWKFEKKSPRNRPSPSKKMLIWNRKINFSNVRKSLLELLQFLAKINISLIEFRENKIFREKPFEAEGSYIFIKAVKYGNYESVKKMLEKNRFYALEYDYMEQTGLHWAAIKGFEKIASLLLEKGSYIDHLDKSERPPLFYAIRNGNYSLANLLLYYQAKPWSNSVYDLISLTSDKTMQSLLKLAKQIHMCLKYTPPRLRNLVWLKEKERIKNFFPIREI